MIPFVSDPGVLALDLLVLVGLSALGYLLVRLILQECGALEVAAFAFPVGSGTFTWLLFLLSWAKVPLGLWSILLAYFVALGLLGLGLRLRRPAPNSAPVEGTAAEQRGPTRSAWIGLPLALAVFLAFLLPVAVGRGHSQWDAPAIWITKGYGIALEGDIRAADTWGAFRLAYPLNIPLMATVFRIFTADQLPGSMLTFPLYAASLAAGVYRFWQRQGMLRWLSLLGVALLLTNPQVMLHSSIAYANLPTSVYVALGACSMIDGLARGNTAELVIGSLVFGLAGWTRSEAVAYGLFVIPALLVLHRIVRQSWPSVRAALLPFVVIETTWFAFGWASVEQSHLGGAMRGVLPRMQAGEFRLFELYLIPRLLAERALDPEIWGYLFPVVGVLCLAGLSRLLRRRPSFPHLATFVAAGITTAIPIGIFYVRAFTRQQDFIAFLNRAFDRAFLPAAAMLVVLGFLLAFVPARAPEDGVSAGSIAAAGLHPGHKNA